MTNKTKRFFPLSIMFLLAAILIISTNPQYVQASDNIRVIIDGKVMETDTIPIIINSRVLVPFRAIFENLGSTDIEWTNSSGKIKATIDKTLVELQIDNPVAHLNKESVVLDSSPIIRNGRTLVPIRFIAESTGENEVTWNAQKKEVHINTTVKEQALKNNTILNSNTNKEFYLGEDVGSIIGKFGQPDRKDDSEQGYTWYIYNKDLHNYFQVGIRNNKVVAFGSNSTNWEFDGFKIGKNNNKIVYPSHVYNKHGYTISILADTNKGNIASTIFITDTDLNTKNYIAKVNQGLSLQLHDLVNVYRLRNGLHTLKLDDKLTELAKYHSTDMAKNNFFSHSSSNGDSFQVRASKIVETRFGLGENISAGYPNALHSSNGLYNSLGHRNNILNEKYYFSGTYVEYGIGEYEIYYTHVFQYNK